MYRTEETLEILRFLVAKSPKMYFMGPKFHELVLSCERVDPKEQPGNEVAKRAFILFLCPPVAKLD